MNDTARQAPPPAFPSPSIRARALLVVDDEPQIRLAVRTTLQEMTDRVLEAATGAEAIKVAAAEEPDLVILDLGLPDVPGIDVCRAIRRWATMPIVVLSARHSEQEKVLLLDAGADDYVTKPFGTEELAARVHAQLRRARLQGTPTTTLLSVGDLSIDFPKRAVSRCGSPIHLTPTEWSILATLVGRLGRTLTHQQIYDAVWGRPFGNPQQYLRVYVTNLRRKIEVDPAQPRIIVTEPGVGYRAEL